MITLRVGAVGLNLTAASRVVFLTPCLDPALRRQAIGRCHRIGQKLPVKVTRILFLSSRHLRPPKAFCTRPKALCTRSLTSAKLGDDSGDGGDGRGHSGGADRPGAGAAGPRRTGCGARARVAHIASVAST